MATEAFKPLTIAAPGVAPGVALTAHDLAPTAATALAASIAAATAAPVAPQLPDYEAVPLKSLKLRAGMFLQAQRMEKNSPTYEAQYLGAVEGKCLFVVPVGTFSIKTGMKANEHFIVRGFTGTHDFQFQAKVIQAFDFTFREPAYAYAVLSFPETVQARKVRNSIRIKTSLPATATPRSGATPLQVTIVDLSVDGALLRSDAELGAVGDLVNIAFSIGGDDALSYLEALARICHCQIGNEDAVSSGVLFENMGDRDRLRIREFVVDAVE
ncbi:MAG: PilZ domain-containing protein [Pseudoxanthomonas sp.]